MTLICPEGSAVESRVLNLKTCWDGDMFYDKDKPYIELRHAVTGEVYLSNYPNGKTWDGVIEWSTDAQIWHVWDGGATTERTDVLYIRGTGNTTMGLEGASHGFEGFTEFKGNIELLLDYQKVEQGIHPYMAPKAFKRLFYNLSGLEAGPKLPVTSLTSECYMEMFSGCQSLGSAPQLPATTCAVRCYKNMFYNCNRITEAPELPATTLAEECYAGMFNSCDNLAVAPELPATSLSASCYSNMFAYTKISEAPELKATSVRPYCYEYMFAGCSKLETAPELPALIMEAGCYRGMFQATVRLLVPPALPGVWMAESCYEDMFSYTSIAALPELRATMLESNCYRRMFMGSTSIRLSTRQTSSYQNPYRIPSVGTASGSTSTYCTDMFKYTGGSFKDTPQLNTTFYTSNTVIPSSDSAG